MRELTTQVLIVGAGPSGLALAVELGSRGIHCLVLERNPRVGYSPRAKTTNVRTREHLRRWGIAQKLAEASPFGTDYPSNVIFVTRLAGYRLARFENALNCAPEKNELYSEHAQWIPQYKLESALRDHALNLPAVSLEFNCEFLSCSQSETRVSSVMTILETGESVEIKSSYLVGADGAKSALREIIGARLEGAHAISHNYNIIFRAPGLAQAHDHGPAIMYWQINPDAPSLIGPMDSDDRWFFMPTGVPGDFTLTKRQASEYIAKSTGIDTPMEILSSDRWVASRLIADKYRKGRIFLIGDACHLHPPFGGYGMNMGIADSVDLGWKLAAVISRWGGESLLDSYEVERRPVHQQVIDEAVANHSLLANQLWKDGLEDEGPVGEGLRTEVGEKILQTKNREFYSLGIVLGYRYRSTLIAEEEPLESEELLQEYEPSAKPGRLAPHRWLSDGSSLYDHFGRNFTLLATDPDHINLSTIRKLLRECGVPTKIICPGEPSLRQLYQFRYALIRPDQHIAWRGNELPSLEIFERAIGKLVQYQAPTTERII